MAEQPDNLVLEILRGLRTDIGDMKAELKFIRGDMGAMASKADLNELWADVTSELSSLRADVASDLLKMQKETREQIAGLRRAVIEYHSSVVGHGMLISDLEERVRRIEQRLDISSSGSH